MADWLPQNDAVDPSAWQEQTPQAATVATPVPADDGSPSNWITQIPELSQMTPQEQAATISAQQAAEQALAAVGTLEDERVATEEARDAAIAARDAALAYRDTAGAHATTAAGHVATAAGHVTTASNAAGAAEAARDAAIAARDLALGYRDTAAGHATTASNAATAAAQSAADTQAALANYVPNTRTINGQPLSSDIVLDFAATKEDVGLGNVDNTSDANKPISTAQQAALDLKANITALALKADLVDGVVPMEQLPEGIGDLASLMVWRKVVTVAGTSLTGVDDHGVTLNYTAGQEQVIKNGIALPWPGAYARTNSGTITLVETTKVGDTLEIRAPAAVTYADMVSKAGDTLTGRLVFMAGTAGAASARIPVGVAPTSPVDGDIWNETNKGTIERIGTRNTRKWVTLLDQETAGPVAFIDVDVTGFTMMRGYIRWNGDGGAHQCIVRLAYDGVPTWITNNYQFGYVYTTGSTVSASDAAASQMYATLPPSGTQHPADAHFTFQNGGATRWPLFTSITSARAGTNVERCIYSSVYGNNVGATHLRFMASVGNIPANCRFFMEGLA